MRSTPARDSLRTSLWLAALPLLLLAPAAPRAQTKKIAILEFSGSKTSGVSVEERQILAENARGIAARNLPRAGWSVMTRDNIQSLLPPGVDLASCSGDECIIETGRKIQADYIATGRIGKLGASLQANVQLYNVQTGALFGTAQPRAKDVDALLDLLDKELGELFADLGGRKPLKALPAPPPRSFGAQYAGTEGPAFLGVTFEDIDDAAADSHGLSGRARAKEIIPESPAEVGGILRGDIVQAVNGIQVADYAEVITAIKGLQPGGTYPFDIWRNGALGRLNVKLGSRPPASQDRPVSSVQPVRPVQSVSPAQPVQEEGGGFLGWLFGMALLVVPVLLLM